MKNILFAFCGVALLFTGCKEHDIPIDFSIKAISDSTGVSSSVPAPAPHQVLVEEFTGESCPNCPSAHSDLDKVSTIGAGNGLVNVISMYTAGSPQSIPPSGAVYDLRDDVATAVLSGIFGNVGGLPAASIDRVSSGGSVVQVGSSSWDGVISSELAIASPVNISVTSAYNAANGTASITAIVTYTQPQTTTQNLSVVIVEDSISDLQEFPSVVQNYTFMDVFRGMATKVPAGDVLQATAGNDTKEAGRFFQKVYAYKLPAKTPAIVPAHCRVIAFVNSTNGSDKHILQSAQCPLK